MFCVICKEVPACGGEPFCEVCVETLRPLREVRGHVFVYVLGLDEIRRVPEDARHLLDGSGPRVTPGRNIAA